MRILVTGGAGFIGSNIVDRYLEAGHEVAVLDDLSTGKEANLNPQAVFFRKDLRDRDLAAAVLDFKPDIVNHLAAQIDVRKSVIDPIHNADINELGTLNLLNAARDAKIKKIIFSSTGGALYGEVSEPAGAAEEHPIEPISPYAITKRSVELYLHAYSQLYGLKYTVLRYGNVYGPRQDPLGEAGVIAIFCGKMLKGETPVIYGDGNQLRDYVYVSDVADANLLALNKGDNQIFNVGTGQGTSVNQLFAFLKEILKFDRPIGYEPPRAGELFRSVLDCRKIGRELGWTPKFDMKEGLKKTVAWY
ncbi:MAG: SDR family oxidoreductase [Candidatus Margulisiibacteriota bacterium]|jgi:UDP-glucose 4-epimerase